MTKKVDTTKILNEILAVAPDNQFIKYIINRIQKDDYRGWHVSQHNRYDMTHIEIIVRAIFDVVGTDDFAIPPGDYDKSERLTGIYKSFQQIVDKVNSEMGRGTINSLKKNFFPDLEGMGFLIREKIKPSKKERSVLYGRLTSNAVEFIQAKTLIDKYKKFTDGIDKLFGSKISDLAEMIHLSDYANDPISIYEFMFIFSDNNEYIDKIELLGAYRSLKKHQRSKVIELVSKYATPDNFDGDKTAKRDFHNWKNQAQQIMGLLKTTVYFEVDRNKYFRLNVGTTGFFQAPTKRSVVPKREYFVYHGVQKREKFELHHIIPISLARNKEEAKMIDDHRNLIYIHRSTHKEITRSGDKHVVLSMNIDLARFSDFDNTSVIEAKNDDKALYARDEKKVGVINKYNSDLLKAIFEF